MRIRLGALGVWLGASRRRQIAPTRPINEIVDRGSARRLHSGRRGRRNHPASITSFERQLLIYPSASLLSSSVETIWCSVSNAMAPLRERSAHLRYDELREIFFLSASQTVRTSEVVSEHSSICKK